VVFQSMIALLALLDITVAPLAWAHFQPNFAEPVTTALAMSASRTLLSSSVKKGIDALLVHLLRQHASLAESISWQQVHRCAILAPQDFVAHRLMCSQSSVLLAMHVLQGLFLSLALPVLSRTKPD
jgi:hypothetical protein